MEKKRENFGSRIALIMALAGSAIGLGNIWRFPYMVGEHGGAAFVVMYVISTLLVSLPVFIAEVTIGRRSACNARSAMATLAPGKRFWAAVGYLPIIIPTIIASYYSVIGGWSLEYFAKASLATFVESPVDEVQGFFTEFVSSAWGPLAAHLLFLFLCLAVVAGGVKSGIEKFSKITLPILFILIVVIAVYSISLPGSGEGVKYLLKPDFSELTPRSFAYAMGQSFYSLSLGMGIVITYGSYVRKDENLLTISAGTAVSDLLFAILAGLAIMPAVFSAGIEPGAGPGLIFQSIPYIFATMGRTAPVLSTIIATLFFLTIVVAAMTSCISLLEVGTAYIVERFKMRRVVACIILFVICGFFGALCSLSFGPLAGVQIAHMGFFDLFDWFSSNILLLIMALLSVVFVGFVMRKEDFRDEISNGGGLKIPEPLFNVIYFLIKWVSPVAVTLIFITNFLL